MTTIAEPAYGGARRLVSRLTSAAKTGPSEIASEIHSMAMYRIHAWILDRFWRRHERRDVAETVFLDQLSIVSDNRKHGVEYTPSSWLMVRWIIRSLGSSVADLHFVDVGSGRGRAVAIASRFPFRSVTGIEFAGELHDQASTMIQEFGHACGQTTTSVALVHGDVLTVPFPDGPAAFYLFNPFDETMVRRFQQRLVDEYARQPRRMIVLYANPVHGELFEQDPNFSPVALPWLTYVKTNWLCPHRFKAFECRPAGPQEQR